MKKLILTVTLFVIAALATIAVLPRNVLAKPEPSSISWTNSGSASGNCLAVLTVNNSPVLGTYAYCPNQSTEFSYPDGKASLYLPDSDPGEYGVILEGLVLVKGNNIPLSYNQDGSISTFQRTDTFSHGEWTGVTTQKYGNQTYYGARNRKLVRIVYLGGSGTITE